MRATWRHIGLLALLVPFVLTSLVGVGAMPARDVDGGLVVVICGGDGPLTLTLDPRTGEPIQPADGHETAFCDWAQARDAAHAAAVVAAPDPLGQLAGAERLDPPSVPRKLARFLRPPARASPHPV